MMSKTMQDALNEQMKHEFYSSYLYLSMSAYCDRANLPGLARGCGPRRRRRPSTR